MVPEAVTEDDEDDNFEDEESALQGRYGAGGSGDSEDDSESDSEVEHRPSPSKPSAPKKSTESTSFNELVAELIEAAIDEHHPVSATSMEIKGLKFAQNKTFGDCLRGIVSGIFRHVTETTAKAAVQKLQAIVGEDCPMNELISSLTQNIQDEVEIIHGIEDCVLHPEKFRFFSSSLSFFLNVFYSEGLLTENAIFFWAAQMKKLQSAASSTSLPQAEQHRLAMFSHQLVAQFLKSVEEGSEDEEEDSSDESDD